jgi:hypothetical protein
VAAAAVAVGVEGSEREGVDVMEGDARVVGVEPAIVAAVGGEVELLEHPFPRQLCFLLAEVDFSNLQMTSSSLVASSFSFLFPFSFSPFPFFLVEFSSKLFVLPQSGKTSETFQKFEKCFLEKDLLGRSSQWKKQKGSGSVKTSDQL